jgi:hypothetical protein
MKVKELIEALGQMNPENEVVVPIATLNYTMGGTPSLKVRKPYGGFDWDTGNTFLHLDEDIHSVGNSFLEDKKLLQEKCEENSRFRKLLDQHGIPYENRVLKI